MPDRTDSNEHYSSENTATATLDAHKEPIDPEQIADAGIELKGHRDYDRTNRNPIDWMRSTVNLALVSVFLGGGLTAISTWIVYHYLPLSVPRVLSNSNGFFSEATVVTTNAIAMGVLSSGLLFLVGLVVVNTIPYNPRSGDVAGLLLGSQGKDDLEAMYFRENGSINILSGALDALHVSPVPLPPSDITVSEYLDRNLGAANQNMYVMECYVNETQPRDGLTKGRTTKEFITGETDKGVPIDSVAGVIASIDAPAVAQVVFAPRKTTDLAFERHKQRVQWGLDQWLPLRLIALFQEDALDEPTEHTQSSSREQAIEAFAGGVHYDVNVRVAVATDDAHRAEMIFDQITNLLDKTSSERYTIERVDSVGSSLRPWKGTTTETVLERMHNRELRISHRYYIRKQRKRPNITVDEETIWNFLLLPGDGNPKTQRGLDTTPRAQSPTGRPTETQMAALRANANESSE